METIQIKSNLGKTLFTYEQKNNTLKITLLEGIKQRANLYGANLRGADLRGADLRGANLYGANLRGANLYEANLYGADLYEANLYEANLYGANLRGANLYKANLYEANLYEANLYEANLYGAKNIDLKSQWFNETRFLPEGDIIGYKKCRNNIIVKLLIPKEVKRSHAFGRKCRAESAKVLEIFGAKEAISQHDITFVYKVGEIIKPKKPFSENWLEECESGIHFFITRVEAENY